jgi:streptogramin lyase
VWVAGIATGNPFTSQIREYFTVNGTSKVVLNLSNVIVGSIIADTSGRAWFAVNATLESYDPQVGVRNVTAFASQNLQYLSVDHQGRLWMTVVGSRGASSIAMFDPTSSLARTYNVTTPNAVPQGITVAPAPDNTIWFAEAAAKKLGRLTCDTCNIEEFPAPAYLDLSAPVQVAVDGSGSVWFTDHGSNQFGVFNPHTNSWKVFPIGYCPDNCVYGLPNAIFVDDKNIVWFSEHIAGRVGRYDPSTAVLTEYVVSSGSSPLMWWAMPGPNNLVWFVAWALGEIGYVNSSIPVPFSVSGPSPDVVVPRGSTVSVPIQVSSHAMTALTFGVSPLTQDQPIQFPSQVYGSSPSSKTLNNNSNTVRFSVSAAWNATLGPRYLALTASDGQVAVNAHVRVVVVEASAPFVALGFSTIIVLGGFTLYLRRPRKPKIQPLKKTRR